MLKREKMDANRIDWPSGDCRPVLATKLPVEELSKRRYSAVFRDQDDLDSFTGAIWLDLPTGPVLVLRHDNNPKELSAFYVDSAQDIVCSQAEIVNFFRISIGGLLDKFTYCCGG
jgi:hypothetical protein